MNPRMSLVRCSECKDKIALWIWYRPFLASRLASLRTHNLAFASMKTLSDERVKRSWRARVSAARASATVSAATTRHALPLSSPLGFYLAYLCRASLSSNVSGFQRPD